MQPTIINAKDRPMETWADAASGTIRWQTLLSKGLTDTNSLVCGIAHLAPGETFTAHRHAEAEVYFGLEGTGTVVIDGQPHDIAPGVTIFIPSNAVHGIPVVTSPFNFFYVFARDSFDEIAYSFVTG
jgi:quercetin dioxygenase-like cupin family protein